MKRHEFTKKTKAQAMLKFKGLCAYCGDKLTKVEFDHDKADIFCQKHGIKSNDLANCYPLCPPCHSGKTKRDMSELVKIRKQDKKKADAGVKAKPSQSIRSGGFSKAPKGYNKWKRKFE